MDEQIEQPILDEAALALIERKRAASRREQRKREDYRHQVRRQTGGASYRKAVRRLPHLERKIHRHQLNTATRRALRDQDAADNGAGELDAIKHARAGISNNFMRRRREIPLAESISWRRQKRRQLIGRRVRSRQGDQ